MIIQIISTLFAIMVTSIHLEIPRKLIFRAGVVGAIGWGIYLLFEESYGIFISTYIAAFAVASISHIFARRVKTPVTIFFIPGIFPLVPGYRLYMSVYSFIAGDEALASSYLIDTIKISGMIALSIFTADNIFHIINTMKRFSHQEKID